MGYTNYWYRSKDFTQNQWEKICLDAMEVLNFCEDNNIVLAWEYDCATVNDKPKSPEVSDDLIRFNGWKEEGHETFVVTKKNPASPSWNKDTKESFDFCKTNRKPYDLAVCMMLLIMKRHAPKSIKISSDGDWDEEWTTPRKFFKSLFGIEAACPFSCPEDAWDVRLFTPVDHTK